MSKQDAEYLAYAKIRKGLQNDCLKDNRFGAFLMHSKAVASID